MLHRLAQVNGCRGETAGSRTCSAASSSSLTLDLILCQTILQTGEDILINPPGEVVAAPAALDRELSTRRAS